MARYIALLRGINVGGHTVKMDRLKDIFEDLGLFNVSTYINSGNIFFDSDKNHNDLTASIEKQLTANLDFQAPVFLRTSEEIANIISSNPFKNSELTKDKRFCVVFTKDPIKLNRDLPILSTKKDMEIISVNKFEAFIVWHIINGRPPAGKFTDGILPANNTTRFYHTLNKILTAAVS